MAYGQQSLRPKKSDEKIRPVSNPLTEKIQQGKTGTEGADMEAFRNMGRLPSSGNFEPGAGSDLMKGGSTASGAMKGEGGRDRSSSHAEVIHAPRHSAEKKPLHPGSKGGAGVGSVDTLTKLIFHPNGGLGHGGSVRPTRSPGYEDSGQKGAPKRLPGAAPGGTTRAAPGMKTKQHNAERHHPEASSGFKDSGAKGPPRKTSGVSK